MATLEPNAIRSVEVDTAGSPVGQKGWRRRFEDPFNTYYRYPIARAITRVLLRTGVAVSPTQVSLLQPFFAAAAGYLLTCDNVAAHFPAVAIDPGLRERHPRSGKRRSDVEGGGHAQRRARRAAALRRHLPLRLPPPDRGLFEPRLGGDRLCRARSGRGARPRLGSFQGALR